MLSFLSAAQAVPDVAVGQHDFEAQHEVARIAVAQHLHAAGVGREIAADHARALGAEAEREEAVVAGRGLLQRLQDAAGLDRHRVADGIDVQHAVHAAERQHDAAVRRPGRGAAHQAGVATLRHDGDAVLVAKPDDLGDFLGAAGRTTTAGAADQRAAPVRHERLLAVLVHDQALLADDRAQARRARRAVTGAVGMAGRATGRQPAFCFPWRILVCTAHVTCGGVFSTFAAGSLMAICLEAGDRGRTRRAGARHRRRLVSAERNSSG